jgi:predicted enzyme related to lactoylglutathione lyase
VSFAAPDADAAARKVTEAGGTVLVGPRDVLDVGRFTVGRFTVARDPASQFWQARVLPGAGLFTAPGSLDWVELMTRTPERAEVFYTTVFGWSVNSSEQYTQWGLSGADFGGTRPASTARYQIPGAVTGSPCHHRRGCPGPGVTHSAVAQHLSVLAACGLVARARAGRALLYARGELGEQLTARRGSPGPQH